MSTQLNCCIESLNCCQSEKSFSARVVLFFKSLFEGLLSILLFNLSRLFLAKRLTRVVLLFATFIVMITAIGRVAWACNWPETASYCQCEIKTSNSVTVARWNDLYKYCDVAGVSIDNRKLRCAETCANTASPLLDNDSELCKAYGDNLPPSTLSAYSWINIQSGNISQGHTVSFPGCTKECVYQANGTSLIGCVTYPTGQPPATLPFTYPPTSIKPSGADTICGNGVNLIAYPESPKGSIIKWYRNGKLLSDKTEPSITVSEGGQYQASYQVTYTDGGIIRTYDLGLSPIKNVPQCPQGTVYHDIDNAN